MKTRLLFVSGALTLMPLLFSVGASNKESSIIFRVERGGIAGTNGYEWILEPDGTWNEYSFLTSTKLNKRDKVQSGKMTSDELASLKKTIHASEFEKLPDKLGEAPKVNPQR